MEEASLDHGLDRLRFFLLLFFSATPALATTFGPISVKGQVQSAAYVVHGRIVSSSWVEKDRQTQRPYTYWKLQVIEQLKGPSLGEEITITQPGGEIEGLGYHVAGTAAFSPGEEVFVDLKDTYEPRTKEVVGLASGKFTLARDPEGKTVLRSGLGFVIRNEKGEAFTPEAFRALVKRIVNGSDTEADKTVMVNQGISHGESGESPQKNLVEIAKLSSPPSSPREQPTAAPKTPPEIPVTTEEPHKGSVGWVAFLALGLALLAGLGFVLKR
jgi:hypothetical protein